jgi:hypothetical protein
MRRSGVARPSVAALAVLLAGAVLLFPNALFRGQTFVERDLTSFYRPAKSLLAPLVRRSAGLPEWNPYFASGQPFAANPENALFHPATWLFFLLPFEWAFRLQVLLPVGVAAASMAFLLRALGRRPWAVAFGALTWAYGGYVLSVTNLLPTLLASSVLPAVLGFAVRVARRGRARDTAGLSLAFGLECLAGDPVTLVMTPAALLAAVAPRTRGRGAGRRIVTVGGGLLLGAAVATVALVPGLNLARKTTRGSGLKAEAANTWSMPPVRLVELVAPLALGHAEQGPDGYWGLGYYPGLRNPFIYSLYPGLLASLLALGAVLATVARPRGRRSRCVIAWTALALAGIGLASGAYGPVWPLARRLPLLSGLRFPEKFILLTMLSVTVLASAGLEPLLRRSRRTVVGMWRSLLVVAGLGVVVAVGARLSYLPWGTVVAKDTALVALTAAAYGLGLVILRRGGAGGLALLVVTLLDLVAAGRRLVPTQPVGVLATPPPVIAKLRESGVDGPVFHAAAWVWTQGGGYGYVRPPMPAFWGIRTILEPDFDVTELRWSAEATRSFMTVRDRSPEASFAVLRRRGAVVAIRLRSDVSMSGGRLVIPPGIDSVVELRYVDRPQPFAFCATRAERFRGREGWIAAVLALQAEARDVVLLEDDEDQRVPPAPSPCVVQADASDPTRLKLAVDAQGPGPSLVAINQTWDEFWTARLDGREAPVLRTDLCLTAVLVPPGAHRLDLRYHDPWLRRGGAVSLLALAASLALAAVRR